MCVQPLRDSKYFTSEQFERMPYDRTQNSGINVSETSLKSDSM